MKLLIIDPYRVLPAGSGSAIRIVQLARSLSALDISVSILAPYHFLHGPTSSCCEKWTLHEVKYPFGAISILQNRPFPYLTLMSFHPGLGVVLDKFLNSYDLVQFEHCSFAGLLTHIRNKNRVIYDAHNVEYDYERSECRSTHIKAIVGRRNFRLEKKLATETGHVFTCSQEDKDRFVKLYQAVPSHITVAPNGVGVSPQRDKSAFAAALKRFPSLGQFRQWVIYSGSDVEHNRAAVRFILNKLAPVLKRESAFIIHGSCGDSFRKQFSQDAREVACSNLFFDADPSHFAEYVTDKTVGLNPVQQGSGTNLKLLHYLNHGLPVISTVFGMRGYDDLRPFVAVAPPEDFATILQRGLFAVPTPEGKLQDRYGWDNIASEMKRVYEGILSRTSV